MEVRDFAMILLMMAGFCRESEIVNLRAEDVWFDTIDGKDGKQERVLFLFEEKSKTDQERSGHQVVFGSAEDPSVCPLRWAERYMEMRDKKSQFFFHQVSNVEGLSTTTPNTRLKQWLTRIGVDPTEFGSHSGRAGGTTAATRHGVPVHKLMRHGNWRSDAVFVYMRTNWADMLEVSRAALRC